jgi:hypothetical protein
VNKAFLKFIALAALGHCMGAIAAVLVVYPPQLAFVRLVLVIALMILCMVSAILLERH